MYSQVSVIDYEEKIIQEVEATPEAHRPALLEIIRLFRQSVTLPAAEVSFREGWHELTLGETKPVYELWEGIDAE